MAAARSVRDQGWGVTRPLPTSRPKLARGCRISDAPGQGATLLMPEAALRLNGPGLRIVQRCDGQHTFTQIVSELQAEFRSPESTKIEDDAAAFLDRLHQRRAVDYE